MRERVKLEESFVDIFVRRQRSESTESWNGSCLQNEKRRLDNALHRSKHMSDIFMR
jgi:hypothetical protein